MVCTVDRKLFEVKLVKRCMRDFEDPTQRVCMLRGYGRMQMFQTL